MPFLVEENQAGLRSEARIHLRSGIKNPTRMQVGEQSTQP